MDLQYIGRDYRLFFKPWRLLERGPDYYTVGYLTKDRHQYMRMTPASFESQFKIRP